MLTRDEERRQRLNGEDKKMMPHKMPQWKVVMALCMEGEEDVQREVTWRKVMRFEEGGK